MKYIYISRHEFSRASIALICSTFRHQRRRWHFYNKMQGIRAALPMRCVKNLSWSEPIYPHPHTTYTLSSLANDARRPPRKFQAQMKWILIFQAGRAGELKAFRCLTHDARITRNYKNIQPRQR
jgi:hypothetical protein